MRSIARFLSAPVIAVTALLAAGCGMGGAYDGTYEPGPPPPPQEDSFNAVVSVDGRFIAFESSDASLVGGDGNDASDVFVKEVATGRITRVSVSTTGAEANGASFSPSLSADGRYVVFASAATNLVPGDSNGNVDVFLHDRSTGVTSLVSVSSYGTQGDAGSSVPSISADGRLVVFDSYAATLVPLDTNGQGDVFVRDVTSGDTFRISVDSLGGEGDGESGSPAISADGRYVLFRSYASNLVPGDTGDLDAFLHDLVTGETTLVSVGLPVE